MFVVKQGHPSQEHSTGAVWAWSGWFFGKAAAVSPVPGLAGSRHSIQELCSAQGSHPSSELVVCRAEPPAVSRVLWAQLNQDTAPSLLLQSTGIPPKITKITKITLHRHTNHTLQTGCTEGKFCILGTFWSSLRTKLFSNGESGSKPGLSRALTALGTAQCLGCWRWNRAPGSLGCSEHIPCSSRHSTWDISEPVSTRELLHPRLHPVVSAVNCVLTHPHHRDDTKTPAGYSSVKSQELFQKQHFHCMAQRSQPRCLLSPSQGTRGQGDSVPCLQEHHSLFLSKYSLGFG